MTYLKDNRGSAVAWLIAAIAIVIAVAAVSGGDLNGFWRKAELAFSSAVKVFSEPGEKNQAAPEEAADAAKKFSVFDKAVEAVKKEEVGPKTETETVKCPPVLANNKFFPGYSCNILGAKSCYVSSTDGAENGVLECQTDGNCQIWKKVKDCPAAQYVCEDEGNCVKLPPKGF